VFDNDVTLLVLLFSPTANNEQNMKGFASSSEVSDQNNVVDLRTTSKHKIGSILRKEQI